MAHAIFSATAFDLSLTYGLLCLHASLADFRGTRRGFAQMFFLASFLHLRRVRPDTGVTNPSFSGGSRRQAFYFCAKVGKRQFFASSGPFCKNWTKGNFRAFQHLAIPKFGFPHFALFNYIVSKIAKPMPFRPVPHDLLQSIFPLSRGQG